MHACLIIDLGTSISVCVCCSVLQCRDCSSDDDCMHLMLDLVAPTETSMCGCMERCCGCVCAPARNAHARGRNSRRCGVRDGRRVLYCCLCCGRSYVLRAMHACRCSTVDAVMQMTRALHAVVRAHRRPCSPLSIHHSDPRDETSIDRIGYEIDRSCMHDAHDACARSENLS